MNKREFAESMKGGYKLLLPLTDVELGYINGYRWGAVYENKGDEPIINDDVLIETYSTADERWNAGPCSIWNFKARTITAFKITDERYKPADTSYLSVSEIPESKSNAENVSDWYDYEAQKAVALPPVGVECESLVQGADGAEWVKAEILKHFDKDTCACFCINTHYLKWADDFRPLDYNRKAEAEKNRVANDALNAFINHPGDAYHAFKHLYELGFLRMPAE